MADDRAHAGSAAGESFEIVDCDVHPTVDRGIQAIYSYMPTAWKERFIRKRAAQVGTPMSVRFTHPNGRLQREDARPPSGKPIAADPAFVIDDLIAPHRMSAAVLNSIQASAFGAVLASADESVVLISAFNDYFIDTWLRVDSRFKLAMSVTALDPAAAVAEIERVGRHPQVVAVAVPLIDVLLGDRRWWPIYDAARRLELPILIHGSGTEGIYHGAPTLAGGVGTYIERYLGMSHLAEANITSLVFSGTFEKFPSLKFIFVEFGFLWLLPLAWRMDRTWRSLRYGYPWVKRSPLEYVHENCRFTTQPMDDPANPAALETLVSMIGYDQLCFSSDYPHWDNELPGQVLRRLPLDAKEKIFCGNAMATLRLH